MLRKPFVITCILCTFPSHTQAESSIELAYEDQITHVKTADGNLHLKPEIRIQSRFSTPFETNPTSVAELESADVNNFEINRARLKVGGHAIAPWFKIKFEYDLKNSTLLDARLTLAKYETVQFRFGRMKAHYSSERVTSSKDMTMVERSMVNNYFTLDRQQGISVLGRLNKEGLFDSNYWIDIFNGTGRTGGNDTSNVMIVGRYQWNFLGEKLGSAMSDLAIRQKPAANIAIAGSKNTSRYSGFNSDGGTQLPGFIDYDRDDQYEISQWLIEGKYHYDGFSLQGEYHQKEVLDTVMNKSTLMQGWYVQSGLFIHELLPAAPKQLELTARYAHVDTDTVNSGNILSEILFGLNWYIFGHRNKVTADIGSYDIAEPEMSDNELRFRLQYDLSF